MNSTRLYVRNIPLSYDNDVKTIALQDMAVKLHGPLKYARARTQVGQLTNFKTGDRFVDIVIPPELLPKKQHMDLFSASLYYKEQKQSLAEVECENCTQKGHVRRECRNETVCYECLKPVHKKGRPLCLGIMIEDVADGKEEGEKDEIIEHQSEGGESENDGDDESGDSGEDGQEGVEKKKVSQRVNPVLKSLMRMTVW